MQRKFLMVAPWAVVVGFSLGACGQQVGVVAGGQPGALGSTEDLTVKPYLGVEEVVQKFQLSEDQQPGPLSVAEVDARMAVLPRLDAIVPSAKQQFMGKLALDPGLALGDPTAQREVIDLRSYDVGIRDQGAEGLCTAFAAVAAVENMTNRIFQKPLNLSERAHWRNYREYSALSSLQAATRYAMVPESVWPYASSAPKSDLTVAKTARIRDWQELALDHLEVIKSLRAGYPVVIAMGVNRSLMNPSAGGIVRAGAASGDAGHAIAIVGAIIDQRVPGGGYYVIKNSWGLDYGDMGYAYVAFDYCESTYCYVWKVDEVGFFKDGVEVSSNDAPRPSVDPVQPVPSVDPADPVPSNVPVVPPAPVSPEISVNDFAIQARAMDLYVRRGSSSQGFYLSIVAAPEILKLVQSVEYWTSNAYRQQGYFKAVSGSSAATSVDPRTFDSMFYPATNSGWTTFPATVKMRDGRSFEVPGTVVHL